MHQRVRQTDPLLVTLGKLADDAPVHLRQPALLHHRGHALARTPPVKALEPRAEFQVFPHAHFGIQRIVFRHVTDAAAHFLRLVKHIEARDAHRAGRRRQETRKNPHGRAFARAIRSEQADNFAARDRERNARHRRATGVAFRQIRHCNHRIVVHRNIGRSLAGNSGFRPTKIPPQNKTLLYQPAKPPLAAFKIMRVGLTLLNRRRKSNPQCLHRLTIFTPAGARAWARRRSCTTKMIRRRNACSRPSGATSGCSATGSRPPTADPSGFCIPVLSASKAGRIFAARSFKSATPRRVPAMWKLTCAPAVGTPMVTTAIRSSKMSCCTSFGKLGVHAFRRAGTCRS